MVCTVNLLILAAINVRILLTQCHFAVKIFHAHFCITNIVKINCSQNQIGSLHGVEAISIDTVMILSFRTDRSGQTVQIQIRLLLEEQSDQGLHCLQFWLHPLR